MGVENIVGTRVGESDEVAVENGVSRFSDPTTQVIDDYTGATRTYPFIKRFKTSGIGTTAIFLHNLNREQLQVSIQLDDGGSPGRYVLANYYPTASDPLNSLTVGMLEEHVLHITVVG